MAFRSKRSPRYSGSRASPPPSISRRHCFTAAMPRTLMSKDAFMSRKAPRANLQILEEASTWFVAFRSDPPDGRARQEFQDWLRRSPEHIRAYLEVASIYADIPSP